jgi:hypothetical protein
METIETQVSAPAAPVDSAPTPEAPITEAPNAGTEDEGSEAPKVEQPKPEAPSRLQKRIDEITRQRYEEQRAREAAETKLAQIERQHALHQQFSQIDAAAPQIDQFQSLADYQMAMAEWTTKRAVAVANAQWEQRLTQMASEQAQQAARMAEQQHRVMRENATLEEKMAAGIKKYPDFQQVLTSQEIGSVRNTPLFHLILEADNAADIAYSLAKNPTEVDRLLSLGNPAAMARAVFHLDRQFSGNAATMAPPPPPSRNGTTVIQKDTAKMTTSEWMAWREGELKKRRG